MVFFAKQLDLECLKIYLFLNLSKGLSTKLHLAPLVPQYGALVTSCAPWAPIRRSNTTTTGPHVAVISA